MNIAQIIVTCDKNKTLKPTDVPYLLEQLHQEYVDIQTGSFIDALVVLWYANKDHCNAFSKEKLKKIPGSAPLIATIEKREQPESLIEAQLLSFVDPLMQLHEREVYYLLNFYVSYYPPRVNSSGSPLFLQLFALEDPACKN